MHKDISPEEKLLSIIKRKHGSADTDSAAKAGSGDKNIKTSAVDIKIDSYIMMAVKNSFLRDIPLDTQIFKLFNRYMTIIIAVITLYIIVDIFSVNPARSVSSLVSGISASNTRLPLREKETPMETKGYSYYLNRITGKRLFGSGSYVQTEPREGMETTGEASGSTLGLVGVIPGNNPQAIIEDKKNQKTYYLIKGQSVDEIVVEDIGENKVMLEYKGKRMTLFL